jgi:3-methyladenine DNA glycosylase AlkD
MNGQHIPISTCVINYEDLKPMTAATIISRIKKLGCPETADHSKRFFKTGPGQYGEGDVFVGVRVPELRRLAKKYRDIKPAQVQALLRSDIHEVRLLALIIMTQQFQNGDATQKKEIFHLYLHNMDVVNNWDLVDISSHHIVGAYLMDRDESLLYQLAQSESLWQRRIAIIATYYFIKHNRFQETLKISKILLFDEEDLIHKAVGWMLREIGKRDVALEENFLKKHYHQMPRTMLRYAIEKFPEARRQQYLKGTL